MTKNYQLGDSELDGDGRAGSILLRCERITSFYERIFKKDCEEGVDRDEPSESDHRVYAGYQSDRAKTNEELRC